MGLCVKITRADTRQTAEVAVGHLLTAGGVCERNRRPRAECVRKPRAKRNMQLC